MKTGINKLTPATLLLGFSNTSGPDLAALVAGIIMAMTGNIYFPTTDPAIAVIQQLLTDYNNAAAAAVSRDRNAVIAKALARTALISGLQALGRNIMSIANGSRPQLESTGFPVSTRGMNPPQEMGAPANLQVTDGPVPFSIYISVDGDPLVKSFAFQYTTDPLTPDSVWTSEFATVSEYIFFDLQPATRYHFRVIAIGTRKQIKFSDTKSRLVQ